MTEEDVDIFDNRVSKPLRPLSPPHNQRWLVQGHRAIPERYLVETSGHHVRLEGIAPNG
ncbi:hypothetical protein Pmar_PMAR012139, partial [Perkinsus marinus ATCC 50983]